ncbi:MAG: potassium-transporting ATPase subunit C [Verrucomicrobiota bacterium]
MKTKLCRWIAVAVIVVALVAVAIVKWQQDEVRIVSAAEESAIADALLAKELSGPRYFNAPAPITAEEDGRWIGVADADAQVSRVVSERNLSPHARREVEALIGKLTESNPSRMVGGKRINLNRLNLSLDSLGK